MRLVDIQGWIFETHNVLFDATVWQRWLLHLLSRMGLHTHYNLFFRVWELEFAPQVYTGQVDFQDALSEFLTAAGMSSSHVNEVILTMRAKQKDLFSGQRPLMGVVETIAEIAKSKCPLAVSADTSLDSTELRNELANFGLTSCFSIIETSRETGYLKPAPQSYMRIVSAMNVPAESVAFVGHDEHHLCGAAALGLQTVAFDCPDFEATCHVTRFAEMAELVPLPVAIRRAG
ncbi:MAG: HAD hydrolase-like protein [Planctomycetales bacterium]